VNGPLLVLWLALASYRLTRIVTLDLFTQPWREQVFNRWPPDDDRAHWRWVPELRALAKRDPKVPAPRVHWLGQLVECPWCCGWWISGLVVAAAAAVGSVPLPLLTWPAVSTLVGLTGEVDLAFTRT
jgi:hypothetical protein